MHCSTLAFHIKYAGILAFLAPSQVKPLNYSSTIMHFSIIPGYIWAR
jgi:hypothetical protein